MKNFLKIILGNIFISFFKIIRQFIEFKFFHLYTSRIGHLALNFDASLLYLKKDTKIIFLTDKIVCNPYILNFFKKQKNVFFINSSFALKIFYCIQLSNPKSDFILQFKKVQPDFSFQFKYKSKIYFPSHSKDQLNNFLLKYNLKNNFVGFHVRNNFYIKKNKLINDKNYHSFRNYDFKDFILATNFLKKKYSIVKLGTTYEEENIENLSKFFGLKIFSSFDFNHNPEADYFLNAYSAYNVVGSSGVDAISSILRKKNVYVNLIPFNLNRLSYCSPGSIIIPKKIFDLKKNRFLNFKELININFSLHTSEDPYKKNQLKIVNNTPEEILNAVIEMEDKIEGKNQDEINRVNEIFWSKITNSNNYEKINCLKNVLRQSISANFLKKNENLYNS